MVIVRTRHCRHCDRARITPDEIAPNKHACRRCSRKLWGRTPCAACGSRRRRPRGYRYCVRCAKSREQQRREASARYYRKIAADPERKAEHVEAKRMEYRLRRERAGSVVRPLTVEQYERRYGSGRTAHDAVDATPLRRLVDAWRDDVKGPLVTSLEREGANTLNRLARTSGISERSLRRALYEEERVSLGVADRVCIALGTHLDLVFAGDRSPVEMSA